MAEIKEYVVYRTPIDTILLDWNNTLWTYGYPAFNKSSCVEIERGFCEGGKALGKFYAELKDKYGITMTEHEEAERFHAWQVSTMKS